MKKRSLTLDKETVTVSLMGPDDDAAGTTVLLTSLVRVSLKVCIQAARWSAGVVSAWSIMKTLDHECPSQGCQSDPCPSETCPSDTCQVTVDASCLTCPIECA